MSRSWSIGLEKLLEFLNQQRSVAPLVLFRICFGLAMAFSTLRFMAKGWVDLHFVSTQFTFPYWGLEWIKPLPAFWMYALHILLIVSSITLTIGFLYRLSAILVFLLFTYFHSIDVTYYLNHYYFLSLISLLLVFLPCNSRFSVDNRLFARKDEDYIPAWTLWILMFQVGVVYFYAGIAKINSDWLLEALPLKIWLPAHSHLPLLGYFFQQKATAYVMSWMGMLFDVSIVFWLLWRKTTYWALAVVVIFHALTGMLFQIGVFPLVMPLAAALFLPEQFFKKVLNSLERVFSYLPKTKVEPTKQVFGLKPLAFTIAVGYLCFQLLFPFRYVLKKGDLFWNEQGYRFSWRVMLMEKAGTVDFYIIDPRTKRVSTIDLKDFLNSHQEKQMAMQPDMILQFAHFLAEKYIPLYGIRPIVKAKAYVTLNGQASQLLINPDIDLAAIQTTTKTSEWITERTP